MYVPGLSYNLFFLKAAANLDHTYWGGKCRIRLFLKEGGMIILTVGEPLLHMWLPDHV